jgi:hypothetical protein
MKGYHDDIEQQTTSNSTSGAWFSTLAGTCSWF